MRRFGLWSATLFLALAAVSAGALSVLNDPGMFADLTATAITNCHGNTRRTILVVTTPGNVREATVFADLLGKRLRGSQVRVVPLAEARPYRYKEILSNTVNGANPPAAALVAFGLGTDAVRVLGHVATTKKLISISTSGNDIGMVALAFDNSTLTKMFYSKAALKAAGVPLKTANGFAPHTVESLKTTLELYNSARATLDGPNCCTEPQLWAIVSKLHKAILFKSEETPLTWNQPYFPHYQLGRAFFHLVRCEAAEIEWDISIKMALATKDDALAKDAARKRSECWPRAMASSHEGHHLLGRRDSQRELLLPLPQWTVGNDAGRAGGEAPDLDGVAASYDQMPVPLVERDGLRGRVPMVRRDGIAPP